MDERDRIEQHIAISAPADRVWELIAEPGWYINDGALVEHSMERDGDLTVVRDPSHGTFCFRTVALDAPRYAAFRWVDDPQDPEGPSTLVEFSIEPAPAGGVVLTVVESGFASLPGDAAERRRRWEENTLGWQLELDLARRSLEQTHDVAR